jgi:acetyl esterase
MNPDASPYLHQQLGGCPATFIMTAEIDPLCDDGEAYGRRLVEAGVSVTFRRYLGMPHGLVGLPIEVPRVREMYEDIGRLLSAQML